MHNSPFYVAITIENREVQKVTRLGPWVLLALALMTAACSATPQELAQSSEPTGEQISAAAAAVPDDLDLAAIYERSCRSCHATPDSKAPLTLDRSAWAARIEAKGIDGLIASAKHGLNAMPPMGQCLDCTDDQLEALITFMAKGSN